MRLILLTFLHSRNLNKYRIVIYYKEFHGATKHVCRLWRSKQKAPETTCTSNASSLQEAASDADTTSSLPIGWICTDFHTFKSNVCLPIGQTKGRHIILTKSFHIWKPSASGPTPTHWTPLKLTWLTQTALFPDSWLQTNKNSKLHDILTWLLF
jgi:hypothetical protein